MSKNRVRKYRILFYSSLNQRVRGSSPRWVTFFFKLRQDLKKFSRKNANFCTVCSLKVLLRK